jgi:hypothetical protein
MVIREKSITISPAFHEESFFQGINKDFKDIPLRRL